MRKIQYYITIKFQGQEYRSVETYDSYTEAHDEGKRRFSHGAVQFDVYTDEHSLEPVHG